VNYLASELDPEPAWEASSRIKCDDLQPLAVVLARAFTPNGMPTFMNRIAEALFITDLVLTHLYGAIMYLPAQAVLMLTPPPNGHNRLIWRTLLSMVGGRGFSNSRTATLGFSYAAMRIIQAMRQADDGSWHVKNYAAWPTGTGAGSDLLSTLCALADCKNISLRLVASNSDNQRLYVRAGFTAVRARLWCRGTPMVRRPFAPMTLPQVTRHPVFLAGRGMVLLIDERVLRGSHPLSNSRSEHCSKQAT
jgi:hypothetical protein